MTQTDIEVNKVLDAYEAYAKQFMFDFPNLATHENMTITAMKAFMEGWRACINEYDGTVPSSDEPFPSRVARWLTEQNDKTLAEFSDIIRQARDRL